MNPAPLGSDHPAHVDSDSAMPAQAASGPKSPLLLVSVRDERELAAAVLGQVDIIDLKEPRLGPLSPAEPELWEIAASHAPSETGLRPLLSAALGERAEAMKVASRIPAGFAFAKVGPSGCRTEQAIRDLWNSIRSRLDKSIELVAVAYADYRAAETIPPKLIFELAAEQGIGRCLIDTYVKDGRSTIQHVGTSGLSALEDQTRNAGIWWTLAGSIRVECVAPLLQQGVRPDCFGVRGDVCPRGREGTLASERVNAWQDALRRASSPEGDIPVSDRNPHRFRQNVGPGN